VTTSQNDESSTAVQVHSETESWLERLVELEEKLAQDLARKQSHQKPALQQQWRMEIAELNLRLELE